METRSRFFVLRLAEKTARVSLNRFSRISAPQLLLAAKSTLIDRYVQGPIDPRSRASGDVVNGAPDLHILRKGSRAGRFARTE
jgi:hypothetical protein